ncbi:MAG: ATP-binding cassette domain-containing protein [Deltaproteobacteria bacterium]|nr:ATP-binding cassette domain-containing protein [Deltaproteobacteria bacterium]
MKKDVLLSVRGLTKHYAVRSGFFSGTHQYLKAVDGVDLDIYQGETLGLVGESGCGKSTLGRLILNLEKPTSGEVLYQGQDIYAASGAESKALRREMQIIFQDPYSSLNPRMTVGNIIGEPLTIHQVARGKEKRRQVLALMGEVGLREDMFGRYPHEFSGGQRQRVGIARALALNPTLIVADEPVSALDVSIQAQVINLLLDLQERHSLTYLFISHALAVVLYLSNRVAVMYLGLIVEMTERRHIMADPKRCHPYTEALLAAVPAPDPDRHKVAALLKDDLPSPINIPPGCRFHTRCPLAEDICRTTPPVFQEVAPGHSLACHIRGVKGS